MKELGTRRLDQKLLLFLAFVVFNVVANPEMAVAHGPGSPISVETSTTLVRGLMAVGMALGLFLSLRFSRLSLHERLSSRSLVLNPVAQTLLGALLAVMVVVAWMGTTYDPFGTVPRLMQFFWPGLVILVVVFGDFWKSWSPTTLIVRRQDRPWVNPLLLLVWTWFVVAYHGANQHQPLALALTVFLVVVLLFRCDPFLGVARVFAHGGFHRGLPNDAFLVIVVLSASIFQLVRYQRFWSELVGIKQGWALTGVSTMGLLATLVIVVVVVTLATAAASYLARVGFRELFEMFTWCLVPISAGLVIALGLSPAFTALQEQLFVLWDPFGRGWDIFDTDRQGITTELTSLQLDFVELGALLLGPVLATVLAGRTLSVFARSHRLQSPVLIGPAVAMIAITAYGVLLAALV